MARVDPVQVGLGNRPEAFSRRQSRPGHRGFGGQMRAPFCSNAECKEKGRGVCPPPRYGDMRNARPDQHKKAVHAVFEQICLGCCSGPRDWGW